VHSEYKNKALFLDRDGVINHLVFRNNGFYSPRQLNDFKLYNDIEDLVNFFKAKQFYIIIISNQPDISRKKMTIEELNSIDIFLKEKLHIDEIYYSFESEVVNGGSKKPSPKMIFEARDKWSIDLSKSYFIGDSLVDLECAKNAKVPFILIRRKHNKDINYHNCIDSLNNIQKIISTVI
tara:strand:- start:2552 stop:3088 length:537 start_codon:yes stop_codon:yes gene_type:complete